MSLPRFVIYCGPMMSSKTTRLMAEIERYKYKTKKVFAFKPKLDSRYTPDEICTHSGSKISARVISDGKDITRCVIFDEPDVIAVDEAFMIDGVADALIDAVCVICGDDAQYTHRKVDNLAEIAVGGAELYEPRCWSHHATARLQ